MVTVKFSNSCFGVQSEAAALCSILHSYRRFCGLFYNDFNLDFHKKEDLEGEIIVQTAQGKREVDSTFTGSEKEKAKEIAKRILDALSDLDKRFAVATRFFFDYELWKLELLFFFCINNEKIREKIFQEYRMDLFESRIQAKEKESGYVEYMEYYYKHLLEKIRYQDTLNSSECRSLADRIYRKWKQTGQSMYLYLVCALTREFEDAKYVQKDYKDCIDSLRIRGNQDAAYEVSSAYYEWGRYWEQKQPDKKRQANKCYRNSFRYNEENYRTAYKLIFGGGIPSEYGRSMEEQTEMLKRKLLYYEKTTNISLRVFLYHYKVTSLLRRLKAGKLHTESVVEELEAEEKRLYEIVIPNIWKRLGMDIWEGSQETLHELITAEVTKYCKKG